MSDGADPAQVQIWTLLPEAGATAWNAQVSYSFISADLTPKPKATSALPRQTGQKTLGRLHAGRLM